MATTLTTEQLNVARFVRRAQTPRASITTWLNLLERNRDALASAPWVKADTDLAGIRHPVNDPALADFSGHQFDAYKQAGNAESSTMIAYAGMVAYRIALPTEGGAVASVSFTAGTDKFCVGGLKIAAVLSNDDTPPGNWLLLRNGGDGGHIDATGAFATQGEVVEGVEVKGILDGTTDTGATSVAQVGAVSFALPEDVAAYAYLYIVASLFDYTANRAEKREYWIEGSGILNAESLAVTFREDFDFVPDNSDVRLPLRIVDDVTAFTFSAQSVNLNNLYLRLHWAANMLLGGLAEKSEASPNRTTSMYPLLAPLTAIDGTASKAVGVFARCYCARKDLAGRTVFLRTITAMRGVSPVRVSLIAVDEIDVADTSVWNGTHPATLGSVVVAELPAASQIRIPITKDSASDFVCIVTCMADVREDDAALQLVGFPDSNGIDLTDAYIAKHEYAVAQNPQYWFNFSRLQNNSAGMIFPMLGSSLYEDGLAITPDGSAAPSGTSYGQWRDLATDEPVAEIPSPAIVVPGNGNVVFGCKSGGNTLYYAGDKSGIDATMTLPDSLSILRFAPIYDGFVFYSRGTLQVVGTTARMYASEIESWSGVTKIVSNTDSAVIGRTSSGTLLTFGFDAAVKAVLEGLTNVHDVALSANRVIALFSDGTARAWAVSGGEIVLDGFAGLETVGCTGYGVYGITAGSEMVYNQINILGAYDPALVAGRYILRIVGTNGRSERMAVLTWPQN